LDQYVDFSEYFKSFKRGEHVLNSKERREKSPNQGPITPPTEPQQETDNEKSEPTTLTVEEFTSLLGGVKFQEHEPKEWFETLRDKGRTLTKDGIAQFSDKQWDKLDLPPAVENVLKKWASPRALGSQRDVAPLGPLKWKSPPRLLYTSGADWKYQPSKVILDQVAETLPSHYQHWVLGHTDKQNHPVYLWWAGPGTGKSRGLEEFPSLCVDSVSDDALKQRLQGAYVFQLTFENGTKSTISANPHGATELGTRSFINYVQRGKVGRNFVQSHKISEMLEKFSRHLLWEKERKQRT
jgi:hypothetical protein